MNSMNELTVEEAQQISDAYAKTEENLEWENCGVHHWDALPRTLQTAIEEHESDIRASKAVVLEALPPQKRGRVERALNLGRLKSQDIPHTRYNLIKQKSFIRSLLSITPSPKLVDVLKG